ncbi:MAG: hypothetical protein ABIR30_10230 [Chitinophagaceae bacterium]
MKKQPLLLTLLVAASLFIFSACDKNNDPAPKTKTQLVSQSSWKFKSATANGTDISNQDPPFSACRKDNILTFTAAGSGTVAEGTLVCSPPENTAFTWNFATGETIIHVSTPLYPGTGNDFTLVSVSETEMVLQIGYSPTVGPIILITITFQH